MATDPEALTQLARLLRNQSLRSASIEAVREAVDKHFEVLVDGLVAEAAASDDVIDRVSGSSFVELRLSLLATVLTKEQTSRLLQVVQGKIEAW